MNNYSKARTLSLFLLVEVLIALSVSTANAAAPFDLNLSHVGATNNADYRGYKWGNRLSSGIWFGTHVGQDYSEGVPTSISFGKVSKTTVSGSYPSPPDLVGCGSRDCGLGNSIMIRYLQNDGEYVYALYGHLDSTSENIKLEKYVVAKQAIGVIGKTGSGSGGTVHLHFEIKNKNDLGTGRAAPMGWGYLPFGATSSTSVLDPDLYGYKNPSSVINSSSEIALPLLSHDSRNPDKSNYVVYGVEGKPINGKVMLQGSFQKSSILVRQTGDRQRAELSDALDDAHKFMGGTQDFASVYGITGTQSYLTGDYLFAGYLQKDGDNRFGYPVKFSFVKNGDVIVDNDQRNSDSITTNDSTSESVYNGTVFNSENGKKVPGYFLTADLFAGKTGSFAQWKPNAANTYKIYVHIPEQGANAKSVRYKIKPDGFTTIVSQPIDQSAHPNKWVQLVAADNSNTFNFTSSGLVGLSLGSDVLDANYNIQASENVAFDAIKFEKVTGTSEVDTLLNSEFGTAWAYFQNKNLSNWFISSSSGVTYGLGKNSLNHSAWISIGGEANIASVNFSNKNISVLSNTNTSSTMFKAISLVGGEGSEWMYNSTANNWARLIEGTTLSAQWYFFQVDSTKVWYIIEVQGTGSRIFRLNLTPDKSNYDWKKPLDGSGNEVDTSTWKKNFYQTSTGQWMVRFTK